MEPARGGADRSAASVWYNRPMTPDTPPTGIALLGCTGSIGTSTLEVLANLGPRYRVVTLAAGRDGAKLAAIAAGLPEPPALLALGDAHADGTLPDGRRVSTGEEALVACATHPD